MNVGGDLVKVATFRTDAEAHVASAALAAEGIRHIVASDDAGGQYPQFHLTRGIRVLVAAEDAARARGVLGVDTENE